MRLRPAKGLSLENFGAIDLIENKNPPMAPEASTASVTATNIIGNINSRPSKTWLAKVVGSSDGLSRTLRSNLKPAANLVDISCSQKPPVAIRQITQPVMTAAEVSSTERATCPSSRER